MEKIRGTRKVALLGFGIIMMALMGVQMVSVSVAATRDENIQKIKGFLSSEKVLGDLQKRGASTETIIKSLDSFNDSQIEKLSNHANLQVGGAIDDSSTSDFWKTWGLLIIIAAVLPIILIALIV